MKRSNHPSLYFSAYPLKAIKQEITSTQTPYLKAILTGKTREVSKETVSPFINLHKYKGSPKPVTNGKDKLMTEVEVAGKDWFKNYE